MAANLIAHMAQDFVNIESLDLSDTDLGDEGNEEQIVNRGLFVYLLILSSLGVAYVVEGLCKSKSVRALKIGKNMRTRTKYRQQAVKNIVG